MTLPRIVTHNFGWKLLALALATAVWTTLHSGAQNRLKPTTALTLSQVPVTLLTAPGSAAAYRTEPAAVDLDLSGPPDLLGRLHRREVQAFVDLTRDADPTALPQRVRVVAPTGVDVQAVTPQEVTVSSGVDHPR
ncbi:MAG TPA: hypothetical protein PKM73_15015 [Verrucomicrobiota bacterium]|nr:hypothetical protein [Verrucomicrobiota bacterium]HNU49327.1 hypothetical protein [Verrucomicrobiota bacterium]